MPAAFEHKERVSGPSPPGAAPAGYGCPVPPEGRFGSRKRLWENPSSRAMWPSQWWEILTWARAGIFIRRSSIAVWLSVLPFQAPGPAACAGPDPASRWAAARHRQNGGPVLQQLGLGQTGQVPQQTVGDIPDIRPTGLHIGAVHLLKEGYQVIHSSLRGVLSCTAAGKYHGVDSVLIVLVIQEHGVDGKNGGQLFPHHLDSLVIELGQLQYCLAVSVEKRSHSSSGGGRMSRYRRRCGRKEMKRAENDIR